MHKSILPTAFLKSRKAMLPEAEFQAFQISCLQPLRKSIRVNTLKISVKDFQKRAQQKNWKLTPIAWCNEGFWIDRPEEEQKNIPLGKTGEHILGLFYIQEASSMLPAEALFQNSQFASESSKFLDMAAAPGSKTTQLSAMTKNTRLIVANEFSASRIKALFSNLQRSGVSNAALTNLDGEKFSYLTYESFDAILLDAPCTGEGTVRKDHNALKNWSQRKIQIAAGIQKNLITAAFRALKPGGILVYSTCTLAPEENEDVCHHLQEKFETQVKFESLQSLFRGAEKCVIPEGFLRIWPQTFDTEGFFVARIRKTSSIKKNSSPDSQNRSKRFPFSQISTKKFQEISKYYDEHFGFSFPFDQNRLWERERAIWLFPEGIEEFLKKMRFDRMGIKLCEIHDKGIKTLHEMAMVFGEKFTRNVVEFSAEQAAEFYAGKDLNMDDFEVSGEVLMKFDGFPMGMGKVQQRKRVKNQLPRGIVRGGIIF